MAEVATPGATARKVGFFDLPREVRDQIYEDVRQELEIVDRHDDYYDSHCDDDCPVDCNGDHENIHRLLRNDGYQACFNIRAIIPEVRLISRQFKSEYDERSSLNNTLAIASESYFSSYGEVRAMPALSTQSTHLQLHWSCIECECDWLASHLCGSLRSWKNLSASFERVCGLLPKLEGVTLTIRADPGLCLEQIVAGAATFTLLTTLVVEDSFFPTVCFARWTCEQGFVVNDTELEKVLLLVGQAGQQYDEEQRAIEEAEATDVAKQDIEDDDPLQQRVAE